LHNWQFRQNKNSIKQAFTCTLQLTLVGYGSFSYLLTTQKLSSKTYSLA
jgi:hypothetical protein